MKFTLKFDVTGQAIEPIVIRMKEFIKDGGGTGYQVIGAILRCHFKTMEQVAVFAQEFKHYTPLEPA